MGCFSYLCRECGKGVNSDSETGEECRIYRLENGEVMQEMRGQYNSYGCVFSDNGLHSKDWGGEWGSHVGAHFNDDKTTGFAIVHERCFKSVPTVISEDDPDQGWGYYEGISANAMQSGDSWPDEEWFDD